MKEKVKEFFLKNRSIMITCIIILILSIALIINKSFAEVNNSTRPLYRNQYFVSENELSDTVLSKEQNGTTNFTHESGPNGARFIGFALSENGTIKYTTVPNAAIGEEVILYSMYESISEDVIFVNLDEDTGKPISGSEFKLVGSNYSAVSVSDKSGRVEFDDVPNGNYKLINTNTSGDYEKIKKEINIKVGG